ncbi:hypothetical protein BD779DRAFT_1574585 [Infundibulicybe gibba]|nr:hypothetical protein BD779DRAFT_1574585 [Infundibulicybe gibba]
MLNRGPSAASAEAPDWLVVIPTCRFPTPLTSSHDFAPSTYMLARTPPYPGQTMPQYVPRLAVDRVARGVLSLP